MDTNPIKQQLYDFCQTYAKDRVTRLQTQMATLQESLFSETKSSAGDKHETGRAIMQLERERLGQQLAVAEALTQALTKVNINPLKGPIGLGSLVRTNKANYFLAISAGECHAEGGLVYCISPNTPIGGFLLGKSVGDVFVFNDKEITVLEVR